MAFWSPEERLRRQAAAWFARMRAPDADRYIFRFRAWLSRDPRHGHAYERLLGIWDEAELLRHRASIEASAGALPRTGPSALWLVPAVAAVALGVAAVALWAARDVTMLGAEVASGLGQHRLLELADGSRVNLDADSAIVPVLSPHQRLVHLLRGRARFSVAHDAGRPFVVEGGGTLVTAHGTVFDVDLIAPGRTEVILRQGVVDVSRRRALGLLRPTFVAQLDGPEAAQLNRGQIRVAVLGSTPAGGDWTSGMLDYDQAPLAQVVADANRYGRRKLRLASPDLTDLQVTGVFHSGVTPDLAASLAATLGLQVASAPNGDLLLSHPGT
jgi:transmembrane sensor